jgi:hypothetical protein
VRLLKLLLVALALLPLLGAGDGDDPVSAAAEALRRDPVFVHVEAERALTEADAERLRDEIRSSGTPVFVAVLPSSAGNVDDVVRRLLQETGLSGTYAVIVGDQFRATSTELSDADEVATAAFQAASAAGPAAVLLRFVDDVAAASAGGSLPPGPGDSGGSQDDDDGGGADVPAVVPVALLAAGGAGLFAWSRRRRRRETEDRAKLAADAELTRAELAVVADDVLRLEPEVVLHPEARNDYEAAVERHRVASAALDYADEPIDLVRVGRVVDEARYAMARAKARLAGREPPPPPEDLRRPGRHNEPPVGLDASGGPVYAGGQPFYGGGWFGGGGLFSGLLLGSMLGGWGWGGPIVIEHGEGDGGDGGFDGGDWGGDIGGGDWGGDIGGGDW